MATLMVLSSWRGHCESSPGSVNECRLSARWSPTLKPSQPTWPASPPVGCYHSYPPSSFISITQPESRYSFYLPTKGGRLIGPGHCSKDAQPVPKAVHRSGCRDACNCSRPLTPHPDTLPLDHCDLQRHVGLNNLPTVVIRQQGGRESISQPSSCEPDALITGLPRECVYNVHIEP